MGVLRKCDLGIFPLYLCEGRKPVEQVLLAYIWTFTVRGQEWTASGLGAAAGTTAATTTKSLAELVKDGVLIELPPEEWKKKKACCQYQIRADFIAERDEEVVQAAKEATKLPGWVFVACQKYSAVQGVIRPKQMHSAMKGVVQFYGTEAAIDGLVKYGRETEARWAPSPYKFAQQATKWIKSESKGFESQSMADMI